MFRNTLLALLAFAAASFGQQDASVLFDKAPPDVDRALRARISEFFQDHVTGEYRKAEKLVAEDTQDYFYDHGKPRYISFEIQNIKYNKDFTQAEAVVLCEQAIMMPGFNGKVMKIPTPSAWKLEKDGLWYWWVDPAKRNLTPFGQMKGGPFQASGAPSMGSMPTNWDEVKAMVKADKDSVSLKPGASETVNIGNAMPGPVTPEIVKKPVGIEVTWSGLSGPKNADIAPASKGVLTIAAGEQATAGDVVVRIQPTGQTISVQVGIQK